MQRDICTSKTSISHALVPQQLTLTQYSVPTPFFVKPFSFLTFSVVGQVGMYHGTSMLSLSGGSETIIFQLDSSDPRLPVGLRLLLSHQEYVLVATRVMSELVGRLWRDFGVVLFPCHDVGDILLRRFGSVELLQGFRRHCPEAAYVPPAGIENSNWATQELSCDQQDHLAFEAFASRFLWLELANPSGCPPKLQADTAPVNASAIVEQLNCSHCEFRPDSRRSLETHLQQAHHFLCDVCGMVEVSEDARHRHKEMRHERCEECGLWVGALVDVGVVTCV